MGDTGERDLDPEHGVHGARRDDGRMQEEPARSGEADEEDWAGLTETGGDAAS